MLNQSETNNLKIAIIEPVGGHGGMNYYDFGLLGGLRAAGILATLYTCDETEVPASHANWTFCFFKRIYGNKPILLRFLRFIVGLLYSLLHARWHGIKIVHYHTFHYSVPEIMQIFLANILGFKVIITIHDVESFCSGSFKKIARYVLGKAHGLLVHNEVSLKEVIATSPETSQKIFIVPHGNYLDYVSEAPNREEARRVLGISNDSSVVLFFGQIKKVKGLDLLLLAWKNVVSCLPNAKLLVVGKVWKDDIALYRNIILKEGLQQSVHIDLRYIPDEEALFYYSAADLVVLPYRQIFQSGVLLMAMSHGRAVLTSDLPGMTEIVKDGVNGFTFRSEDIGSLSISLINALRDSKQRKIIAGAGLATVSNLHGWERIGTLTSKVYEKVLADKNLSR